MHQPSEGRDEDDDQPQHDMQLEDQRRADQVAGGIGVEDREPVRPIHQPHHLFAVQIMPRPPDRSDAEDQLDPQQGEHGDVAD